MSVQNILCKRLEKISSSYSDCEFMSSLVHFYQALFYSHNFLNRHDVSFYNLLLRDFNFLLRQAGKERLLFCFKRFFPRSTVNKLTVNELINYLNPLSCMSYAKIVDRPCIIF